MGNATEMRTSFQHFMREEDMPCHAGPQDLVRQMLEGVEGSANVFTGVLGKGKGRAGSTLWDWYQ